MSATLDLPEPLRGAVLSRVRRVDDDALTAVAVEDDARLLGRRRSAAGSKRTCVVKQRYGRELARRIARLLRQQDGEEVHAYPCGCCAAWHVGHGVDLDAKAVWQAASRGGRRKVIDLRVGTVVVELEPPRPTWSANELNVSFAAHFDVAPAGSPS